MLLDNKSQNLFNLQQNSLFDYVVKYASLNTEYMLTMLKFKA